MSTFENNEHLQAGGSSREGVAALGRSIQLLLVFVSTVEPNHDPPKARTALVLFDAKSPGASAQGLLFMRGSHATVSGVRFVSMEPAGRQPRFSARTRGLPP